MIQLNHAFLIYAIYSITTHFIMIVVCFALEKKLFNRNFIDCYCTKSRFFYLQYLIVAQGITNSKKKIDI